jgi:hypothetical protein
MLGRGKAMDRPQQPRPAPRPAVAEEPALYCPACSRRLERRQCRLVCPGCGYFLSCSDYY